ncbi:MAG: hypothetical protein M3Z66_21630 [Chloroflexota bacterium]|nr:hypothetical protein [Chloroflexota bacterium]
MSTEQLTEQEALVFGQRLDAFAAGLTPGEGALLNAILHDAESAQHDDIDHRTPGDIAMAIHRTLRTPPISLNPLPIPSDSERLSAARRDHENPDYARSASKD